MITAGDQPTVKGLRIGREVNQKRESKDMFVIKHPNYCVDEYSYILKVIFSDFLGIAYQSIVFENEWVEISYEKKQLKVPDFFFRKAKNNWLGETTLPVQPLHVWDTQKLAA